MFTGLVQSAGVVRRVEAADQARKLVIEARLQERDRALGASVAVSGVCLTVTQADESSFEALVGFETLDKTKLGELVVGQRVNVEPSLRIGDPIGGHLVSGHVDGVGTLRTREARGEAQKLVFWVPEPLRRYVAVKGSICIDGVSLTVNEVDKEGFAVGLIPHTLKVTTLDALEVGDHVNLEVDLLARYVERILSVGGGQPAPGLTFEQLAAAGFGAGTGTGPGTGPGTTS